jgi:hypothetical protein
MAITIDPRIRYQYIDGIPFKFGGKPIYLLMIVYI